MALGKRKKNRQGELWVATGDLPEVSGHPFYSKLEKLLSEIGFDEKCEELAAPYYSDGVGRPGLPPGTYARLLLIGYFEGIPSERGIAWRCADSLSLRHFLGFELTESTPDHSTISRIRNRLPVEFHQAVFSFVLTVLAERGLVKGNTVAIDASTMEANAAMKSIVRRDTGDSYQEYLRGLARESGIETPTAEDLKRMDKKRRKKTSNDDWENPHDPDAKITKMKDGRTDLAYKVEHAVDLETEAVVQADLHPADEGDTTTGPKTLKDVQDRFIDISEELSDFTVNRAEVVEDRGYHSGRHLVELESAGFVPHIAEPKRGRRRWGDRRDEQEATYRNRRRVGGKRGRDLQRKRSALVERSFAHTLETGGQRRTWLRGLENVAKRYLLHVAAYNLSVVMRAILGKGTPRGYAESILSLLKAIILRTQRVASLLASRQSLRGRPDSEHGCSKVPSFSVRGFFSTGC